MTAYADYFQQGTNGTKYYVRDREARDALALKAPIASPTFTGTPKAPTASISTNSTQLATTAFVQSHSPIHLTVSAQAGTTVTKNDSRITSTMRVINAVYSVPGNVHSKVTWTTANGSVTFTGTFSGTTNIDFDLVEVN